MSGHESIKEQVDRLNKHKKNVVTAVQDFVKYGKEIGQKIKDKEAAEGILITSKGSEKYTSADIPDLVIHNGPGPTTGSVKINHPPNEHEYYPDEDMKLEFETKHVHLPFHYVVIGMEEAVMTPFLIKSTSSHHDKVLIQCIKENDRTKLPIGTYDIVVRIIDPTTKKDVVPPDKIRMKVVPRAIKQGNTVKLILPSANLSPYSSMPMMLSFKVDGPHHDSNPEYLYQLVYKELSTNNSGPIIAGRARDKEVNTTITLPKGTYEAYLKISDPSASMKEVSRSNPVKFVVDTQNGPGPIPPGPTINIINNIIINNTTNNVYNNVNIPFAMPVNIEIVPNPTYIKEIISQPINISINITKDGSSKEVSERIKEIGVMIESINGKLQFKLKQDIVFKEGGKYNLLIILYRDKVLFRKIIPIIIRDEKTVKKEAKLASIINEIRNDIKNGLATSINSIKIKLDETSKNEDLKPYFKEMRPLFTATDYNNLKLEAEKLMNKPGTKPQVGGVCGAIINRVNEYQYYIKLVEIFKKSKEIENIADYLYILENFNRQKDALENITRSINKSQQDNLERRKPQDSALKIISKIKTATVLVEDNK